MDKPRATPKDFFIWAGAMISLYVSVFSFIELMFNYIDYAFPDPLSQVPVAYSSSITSEMASLIVLFPLFLVLMYLIRRGIQQMPEKREVWVRRWALVLTIFVAAFTVAIDLIVLINNFLSGNLTLPFILKILVVLLVLGGAFLHFLAELWGYWDTEKQKSTAVAWGASLAVLCILAGGFLLMGSPWEVRLYRLDDQKVSDLMQIQSDIDSYYQQERMLPASLNAISNSPLGYAVPVDSQSGDTYQYSVEGKDAFELCATFNAATQWNSPENISEVAMPAPLGAVGSDTTENNDWYHGSGEVCFDRTINPLEYSPMQN